MSTIITLLMMLFPSGLGAFIGLNQRTSNTYISFKQFMASFLASMLVASFVGFFINLSISVVYPGINSGDGIIFKIMIYAGLGYVGNETVYVNFIKYLEKKFSIKFIDPTKVDEHAAEQPEKHTIIVKPEDVKEKSEIDKEMEAFLKQ